MKITFNKQFMVLKFLLLKCFAKQITLKLTEAGTLPNKIGIVWGTERSVYESVG